MLTCFTKKQLHTFAVFIDNAILLKLGASCKLKCVVVYGPLDLGYMEYPYIGIIQNKKGIGHLVRHLK